MLIVPRSGRDLIDLGVRNPPILAITALRSSDKARAWLAQEAPHYGAFVHEGTVFEIVLVSGRSLAKLRKRPVALLELVEPGDLSFPLEALLASDKRRERLGVTREWAYLNVCRPLFAALEAHAAEFARALNASRERLCRQYVEQAIAIGDRVIADPKELREYLRESKGARV